MEGRFIIEIWLKISGCVGMVPDIPNCQSVVFPSHQTKPAEFMWNPRVFYSKPVEISRNSRGLSGGMTLSGHIEVNRNVAETVFFAYKASANKIKLLKILIQTPQHLTYLGWTFATDPRKKLDRESYLKCWGVQIKITRVLILFADALYCFYLNWNLLTLTHPWHQTQWNAYQYFPCDWHAKGSPGSLHGHSLLHYWECTIFFF